MRVFPALVVVLAMAGCSVPDDDIRFNQLERLRVLALRAEPPDVIVGDQIELSALVYEPSGNEVSYSWSWCPRLGNSDDGFACRMDEAELSAAWAELSEVPLPPFDLGSTPEVTLDTTFDPELALPLCEALTRDLPSPDTELFLCLNELEINVVLTVETDNDEVRSFRALPLADLAQGRNTNPDPVGDFEVAEKLDSDDDDPRLLDPGEALRATATYVVTAGFAESQAEMWSPPEEDGLPPPEPRPEALFLSWFVTTGEVDEDRTNWVVPGDFATLLENDWEMARDGGDRARLLIVLRDERGGVGWTDFDLGIVEDR